MNTNLLAQDDDWVPAACTLPTVEQPLRRAEFDALFSQDVIDIAQASPQQVTLTLRAEPEVAARAAKLAAAETGCCSFFTFGFTITDGRVDMVISAASPHEDVLAALATRATSLAGAA